MEQVNLTIKIGDRDYPIVVPATDEQRVREAEQLINNKIREYRSSFPGADKTDHAAMTAFFLANALLSVDNGQEANSLAVQEEIDKINELLNANT